MTNPEDVISEEDYLVFPDHPKFSFKPADKVVGFDQWVCSGIWVPLEAKEGRPERDAFGTPTLELASVHQTISEGAVPVLPRADAWKISRDPEWVESLGTRKGVWTSENNPFKRTLNALNQFLKSRETAIFTPHQVVIQGFRDHTGLFKAAHEGPHLPSGIEAWGGKRAEKKISQWEEECWFIRDMEGCLKAFWEDSMCRPGADRMKVTVYDKFEIVRSFLLYMEHYDIYPKAQEPHLARALERCCALSREVQDKMYTTSILYGSLWARADGWSGLGKTIWAPEIDDEVDEDEQRKVVDYAAIEVDEEALREGMDEVIVQDVEQAYDKRGQTQDEHGGQTEEEHNQTLESWTRASAPELTPFASLPRATALVKLQEFTGKSVIPDDYVRFEKRTGIFDIESFTHATVSSSDSVTPSDSPEIGLSRLAVDKRPKGFGQLDLVDASRPAFKANILIDMDEGKTVDWVRMKEGAKGLKVRGTLVGVKRGRETGEGETIWFFAKIKGVDPNLD